MWQSAIGRLRIIGIIEGLSYLLLLGVAMPLKYLAGMPEAVSAVGMAHGMLFLIYCLALLQAMLDMSWPIKRAAMLFIAAVLPFGPFVVDGGLRREQEALATQGEASD